MTAAASFVDLGEELVSVRGGFIEDSEDEELYPAPFWILPTVAAALIAHGTRTTPSIQHCYIRQCYINIARFVERSGAVREKWNENVTKLSRLTG